MILTGVAVVMVAAECINRMERRLSRAHPFLTELVDEKGLSPWPFR